MISLRDKEQETNDFIPQIRLTI